jgi:hypothetical protein
MQFSKVASVFLAVAGSIQGSPLHARQNTTEKRYAILDNDWSPAGFIPFLMALDAGIEILGIASCQFLPTHLSLCSSAKVGLQQLPTHGKSKVHIMHLQH